jgi:hypothetical protein
MGMLLKVAALDLGANNLIFAVMTLAAEAKSDIGTRQAGMSRKETTAMKIEVDGVSFLDKLLAPAVLAIHQERHIALNPGTAAVILAAVPLPRINQRMFCHPRTTPKHLGR